MTGRRVTLVASNDTHVRMFAPVVRVLEAGGSITTILSLDAYYGQRVAAEASAQDLEVQILERPRGEVAEGGFYHRPTVAVWADVIAARRIMRRAMQASRPDTVVVANDRGLLEKLALLEARRVGARTVLVQDGRMAPRPKPSTLRSRVRLRIKAGVSAVLRAVGLPFLAASEYGASGVDLICASGRASARLLGDRARGRSRVVVTGQPRYDAIAGPRPHEPRVDAAMITTPFERAGLGRAYQDRQMAVAFALSQWAQRHGRRFVIRPHPREDPAPYREAFGEQFLASTASGELLAASNVAVIGMSTMIEEAAMLGCPVVVPGAMVHGRQFDALLPPEDVYPRCDSMDQLISWLERTRDPSERAHLLDGQVAHVDEEVDWRGETPASERVAAAILAP